MLKKWTFTDVLHLLSQIVEKQVFHKDRVVVCPIFSNEIVANNTKRPACSQLLWIKKVSKLIIAQ